LNSKNLGIERRGDFIEPEIAVKIWPILHERFTDLFLKIQRSFTGEISQNSYTYKEWEKEYQALFQVERDGWIDELDTVNNKLKENQRKHADFLPNCEFGFSSNIGRQYLLHVEPVALRVYWELPGGRIKAQYSISITRHCQARTPEIQDSDGHDGPGKSYTLTQYAWVWPIDTAVPPFSHGQKDLNKSIESDSYFYSPNTTDNGYSDRGSHSSLDLTMTEEGPLLPAMGDDCSSTSYRSMAGTVDCSHK
jgi:hypothetical protein